MNDHQAAGLCGDAVIDTDGTRYGCVLPAGHLGWHLDTFRLVDDAGNRLPCELRWAPATVGLDDVLSLAGQT